MKTQKNLFGHFGLILASGLFLNSVSRAAPRPASELVAVVNRMDSAVLAKLGFVELNLLKNAVMANSGYEFAGDRFWLSRYFYEADSQAKFKSPAPALDLSGFEFPKPGEGFVFKSTSEMNLAIARIRQAHLKKLRDLTHENQVESVIVGELKKFPRSPTKREGYQKVDRVWILGRPLNFGVVCIDDCYDQEEDFRVSLIRDLKGDLGFLSLVDQFKQDRYDFDVAELLGLYLGNLDLLRKVILARAGRTFEEPLKTELLSLGVKAEAMSVGNLSGPAKSALQRLDSAISSLSKGQLNDIPESMKVKALNFEDPSLSYGGAM